MPIRRFWHDRLLLDTCPLPHAATWIRHRELWICYRQRGFPQAADRIDPGKPRSSGVYPQAL